MFRVKMLKTEQGTEKEISFGDLYIFSKEAQKKGFSFFHLFISTCRCYYPLYRPYYHPLSSFRSIRSNVDQTLIVARRCSNYVWYTKLRFGYSSWLASRANLPNNRENENFSLSLLAILLENGAKNELKSPKDSPTQFIDPSHALHAKVSTFKFGTPCVFHPKNANTEQNLR